MSKKKTDDLLIKEIYEYTINEKTYKGHCKILKVAKTEELNDWGGPQNLILENGQRLSASLLYDLYRDNGFRYFESHLRFKLRAYTIVKVPNIKEIFKRIKETAIEDLSADIKSLKKDVRNAEARLKALQRNLEEKTVSLELLKGN